MKNYTSLVFAFGSDYAVFEYALDTGGEQSLFEKLLEYAPDKENWEYMPQTTDSPAGETDRVYIREYNGQTFEICYNLRYGYAGLCLITEK